MKVIAFGHRRDTGKDTCVNFAATHIRFNYQDLSVLKAAFAKPLKDTFYNLYKHTGIRHPEFYDDDRDARDDIIPKLGMSIRDGWIKFSNHVRSYYNHTWIDMLFQDSVDYDILLISDLRYQEEVQAIRDYEHLLVRVDRDEVPKHDDPADSDLADFHEWDHVIENNYGLNELNTQIQAMLDGFLR